METKAIGRYIRISPSKLRLVAKQINKDSVSVALSKLEFINKAAAPHVLKVLKSAVANASKNHGADADKLYVMEAKVDDGPILKFAKRFHAQAMGRAAGIRKKAAHLTIVVTDKKLKKES
jgi:large subunit ribosomal protein L22